MTVAFDVVPIPSDVLAELLVRDDAGRVPEIIDGPDAEDKPLRCCLRRSLPGERIALLSYAPLRRWAREAGADPGPYDELGPVFVHAQSCAGPVSARWPEPLRGTLRVLRAYSADGRILGGCLLDSPEKTRLSERTVSDLLADPEVAMVHVRAVEHGCYLFAAQRTPAG